MGNADWGMGGFAAAMRDGGIDLPHSAFPIRHFSTTAPAAR
ncbi:hypothetical protein PLANPX_4956 [Lacipirellula parvula]|uniref:Uncharacterized protein n=1 Tax=Lacipirellula parvula TaxID=2650471 RepID=A0A5K7XEP5_9BACT|nr:hypothetical protein PLANPX_4956 [Lacipirellula parvula]